MAYLVERDSDRLHVFQVLSRVVWQTDWSCSCAEHKNYSRVCIKKWTRSAAGPSVETHTRFCNVTTYSRLVSSPSLMVQRDQWDTYWGPKKLIFLIRDIDDGTMAAASVETCRFVVLRPPGARLGSVPYTCNRLRGLRGRIPLQIHLAKMHLNPDVSTTKCQDFDQELSGEPQVRAHAA